MRTRRLLPTRAAAFLSLILAGAAWLPNAFADSYPAQSGWMVGLNGFSIAATRQESCVLMGPPAHHDDDGGVPHGGGSSYAVGGVGSLAGTVISSFCHEIGAGRWYSSGYYCPNGGALSGDTCINATACTPPDVRDPETGQCGPTKQSK